MSDQPEGPSGPISVDPQDRAGITQLLQDYRAGDRPAFDRLVELVYGELKGIARRQLRNERQRETINTGALVHEAYFKLIDERSVDWQDRQHFYAIAARTMRRILVDHARVRRAKKRGSGVPKLTLEPDQIAAQGDAELVLAVDQALDKLAEIDPRLPQVVEQRFFAGLSIPETADALGLSQRTVERSWTRARAWLLKELG